MKRIYSIIVLVMFAVTNFPFHATAAERISVAVSAAQGADSASREAAQALRSSLRLTSGYHIVDPQIVGQVMNYYDDNRKTFSGKFQGAQGYLARAQDHYFSMQYEEAGVEVRRAINMLESNPAPMDEKGQLLFDSLMTQGMIARASKNGALAEASFNRAVRLNPAHGLSRRTYPPSVVDLFNRQRSVLVSRGASSLSVNTNPQVAEVYLNGIMCGVTPLTLPDVPAGKYSLVIKTNKYRPIIKRLNLKAGGKKRISERLDWTGGAHAKGEGRNRGQYGMQEIESGLRVAELLKTDRAVLISGEENADGSGMVRARLVDRKYRAGFRPFVTHYSASNKAEAMAQLSDELNKNIGKDVGSDPGRYADPQGTADPILLGKKKKKIYKRPLFWGAIGTAMAGAVAGGVIAAMSGGSGGDGRVKVRFR